MTVVMDGIALHTKACVQKWLFILSSQSEMAICSTNKKASEFAWERDVANLVLRVSAKLLFLITAIEQPQAL